VATPLFTIKHKDPEINRGSPLRRAPPRGCDNGYVYLMKHKSKSFERFKEFRIEVEKQTRKSIKILRLDRSGEYLSQLFQDYLKDNEILSQ